MSLSTSELLQSLAQEIEEALDQVLPSEEIEPTSIHRAMRHAILAGGKRLRPALVLLCAEAAGATRVQAMPVAVALELIHTYSLVHDDLPCMDDDELRRGQPTVHVAFGEAMAVLAGDALLTLAFAHLGDATQNGHLPAESLGPIIAWLGHAAGTPAGMIAGQVLDIEAEDKTATEESLAAIHRAKTGALLEAACVCGAMVADPSRQFLQAFSAYGKCLGLAFQIIDDILDATADSATLGKTAGKDADQGKATYVALHGLDAARDKAQEQAALAKEAIAPLGEKAQSLIALMDFVIDRDR